MQNKEEKAERAKLFLPFDSLKGFREYLKKKERVVVEQKQLSNDALEQLDRSLQQIIAGRIIKVVYYDEEEYVELVGMVVKIDTEYTKTIQIVDKTIQIKNIIEIQGITDPTI